MLIYAVSYNELEQLHMQVLLNCHLAAFNLIILYKKWPSDNFITLACVIAIVHYSQFIIVSYISIGKTELTWLQLDNYQFFFLPVVLIIQSTWLQLDISLCHQASAYYAQNFAYHAFEQCSKIAIMLNITLMSLKNIPLLTGTKSFT